MSLPIAISAPARRVAHIARIAHVARIARIARVARVARVGGLRGDGLGGRIRLRPHAATTTATLCGSCRRCTSHATR